MPDESVDDVVDELDEDGVVPDCDESFDMVDAGMVDDGLVEEGMFDEGIVEEGIVEEGNVEDGVVVWVCVSVVVVVAVCA
jgi:hypothetical protein